MEGWQTRKTTQRTFPLWFRCPILRPGHGWKRFIRRLLSTHFAWRGTAAWHYCCLQDLTLPSALLHSTASWPHPCLSVLCGQAHIAPTPDNSRFKDLPGYQRPSDCPSLPHLACPLPSLHTRWLSIARTVGMLGKFYRAKLSLVADEEECSRVKILMSQLRVKEAGREKI